MGTFYPGPLPACHFCLHLAFVICIGIIFISVDTDTLLSSLFFSIYLFFYFLYIIIRYDMLHIKVMETEICKEV